MAAISSTTVLKPYPCFLHNPTGKSFTTLFSKSPLFHTFRPRISLKFSHFSYTARELKRLNVVAEEASVSTADPSSEAARRLYVGNIPRTVTNEELTKIVEEHGAVEKAEVFQQFMVLIAKLVVLFSLLHIFLCRCLGVPLLRYFGLIVQLVCFCCYIFFFFLCILLIQLFFINASILG